MDYYPTTSFRVFSSLKFTLGKKPDVELGITGETCCQTVYLDRFRLHKRPDIL